MTVRMHLNQTFEEAREALAAIHRESLEREEEARNKEREAFIVNQLPPRYRQVSFDNYEIDGEEQALALEVIKRYVETFSDRKRLGNSLMFLGYPGTGKTHLACSIYKTLSLNRFHVRYIAQPFYFEGKAEAGKVHQLQEKILETCDLLILDEVQVGLSAYCNNLLFQLIDARYSKQLPTILISNATEEALRANLGDKTLDRLSQGGAMIGFNWGTYR